MFRSVQEVLEVLPTELRQHRRTRLPSISSEEKFRGGHERRSRESSEEERRVREAVREKEDKFRLGSERVKIFLLFIL